MPTKSIDQTESLVRFSRRSLWLALFVLLALLAWAAIVNIFPGSVAALGAGRLGRLMPIFIITAVAALSASRRGWYKNKDKDEDKDKDKNKADIKAQLRLILADKLRQASLSRAWRHGFVVMLLAQPALALMLTWHPVTAAPFLMAGITAALGAVSVLGTVLWLDR